MLLGIRWGGLRAKIITWSFVPTAIILTAVALVGFYAYQQVTENLTVASSRELARLSASELAAGLTEYGDTLTALARTASIYTSDPTRSTSRTRSSKQSPDHLRRGRADPRQLWKGDGDSAGAAGDHGPGLVEPRLFQANDPDAGDRLLQHRERWTGRRAGHRRGRADHERPRRIRRDAGRDVSRRFDLRSAHSMGASSGSASEEMARLI